MITKIEKLKNIGNFEDYTASGDVTLKRLSIVYADNGAGKTTLARVLHSLSANDPDVVLRHKRINGTGNPEITIKNDQLRHTSSTEHDGIIPVRKSRCLMSILRATY